MVRRQPPSGDSRGSAGRVIPRWAASVVARLAEDAPRVVTRDSLQPVLADVGSRVDAEAAIRRLLRLGWLRSVSVRGAYAFVAPGVDELADPYIDLRAWRAKDRDAVFYLAGDNAAWHLGYLDRTPQGTTVWLPADKRLPKGLRSKVTLAKTAFPTLVDERILGPSTELLRKRRLDSLTWSSRLPAFGPEALLVQLASRPASFKAWDDLAGKLDQLAQDVDMGRLEKLLARSSNAARQRAAYLLHVGSRDDALKVLPSTLQPIHFGSGGNATWDPDTNVSDHIVARLRDANAKA